MEKITFQLEELNMSVRVHIDGSPAECREDYSEAIGRLGPIPGESQYRNPFGPGNSRPICVRHCSLAKTERLSHSLFRYMRQPLTVS